MVEERNMYGCLPCSKCGSRFRAPFCERGRNVIICDDCGCRAPWDGTWGEDGHSANEVEPAPSPSPTAAHLHSASVRGERSANATEMLEEGDIAHALGLLKEYVELGDGPGDLRFEARETLRALGRL